MAFEKGRAMTRQRREARAPAPSWRDRRSARPWRDRLLTSLQPQVSDPGSLPASTLTEFFAGFQWDEDLTSAHG